MKYLRQAALALAAASVMSTAHAGGPPDEYVAIDLFAVQHEERIPERDLGFGGRLGLGHVVSRSERAATGVEFGLLLNPIEGDVSGDQYALMIDLVQRYSFGGLTPYVFGGIGGVGEDIGPVDGFFLAIEAGAGLLFSVSDSTTARVGLSAMSVHNDELIAGQDAFVDYRFNVGLLWGTGATAAPTPAPAAPARAVDSDGDGLADSADRCPDVPASTSDGCPPAAPVVQTDSDGDGVYDAADTCPGTLEGLKVDERGCAVQSDRGEKQSVVLKGVTFLPGSATLTAEAKAVLDTAHAALAGQQDLKVEIGGHTDAQGSDAANQKLSQRRADSVRQYLVDKGIGADRLTAVGYGEAQPIATNDTPAGRAENRRVEFKIR
jgi:OOP family OmpA-OmpF porin